MNCKEFDERISLYIDGELNKDEEKVFLDHSTHCQRCQISLENTMRMIGSLDDLKHIKAPKDLSRSIIQALEKECFVDEESLENPEESSLENVQEGEQRSERKIGQSEIGTGNRKGWFLKQSPWIKRISLAAVLVLIVTSAVILTTDWLPSPVQDDMMVMESGEESALEERGADESGDMSDSIENGEAPEPSEGPGITAMEEEEAELEEKASSEEDFGGEEPDIEETPAPEDGQVTSRETEDEDTFGINYGIWIALLLGIGVISVIMVFIKNLKQ